MKNITCILCPNGCEINVFEDGSIIGNLCKRGQEFAIEEINDPKRTITTTCKTIYNDVPVVAVKSDKLVKKDLVLKIVNEINKVVIDKPLQIGDVVIENVLDSGTNIIICTNDLKEKK